MVQNSLGRLWFEMYPDSELIKGWEFFLKPEPEDMTVRSRMSLSGQEREETFHLLCRDEGEKKELEKVLEAFRNARNFGSLIIPPEIDYDRFIKRLDVLEGQLTFAAGRAAPL